MFIQVISGRVSDAAAAHAALDRWMSDLAPRAEGWLGTTAGVTDDGTFVALARFESADAARRNSDSPEQDAWWNETSVLFDGEVTFHDSADVVVDLAGDPDTAGFVQIMRGRGTNPSRARELMSENSETWAAFRPDVLGSVAVMHDHGEYTMANYFTSEAEARVGEQKEPPPELRAQMEEMEALNEGPPTFYDIAEPWLYAPR